jgi:hypothetical protein
MKAEDSWSTLDFDGAFGTDADGFERALGAENLFEGDLEAELDVVVLELGAWAGRGALAFGFGEAVIINLSGPGVDFVVECELPEGNGARGVEAAVVALREGSSGLLLSEAGDGLSFSFNVGREVNCID